MKILNSQARGFTVAANALQCNGMAFDSKSLHGGRLLRTLIITASADQGFGRLKYPFRAMIC